RRSDRRGAGGRRNAIARDGGGGAEGRCAQASDRRRATGFFSRRDGAVLLANEVHRGFSDGLARSIAGGFARSRKGDDQTTRLYESAGRHGGRFRSQGRILALHRRARSVADPLEQIARRRSRSISLLVSSEPALLRNDRSHYG